MILERLFQEHHAANAAAIGVPLSAWAASWLGVLQPIAAFVLTLCGIGYYCRLFYKDWRASRNKG